MQHSVQLVNCGLSDITIKALEARGITALFPIQKHVYEPAAAGRRTRLVPFQCSCFLWLFIQAGLFHSVLHVLP